MDRIYLNKYKHDSVSELEILTRRLIETKTRHFHCYELKTNEIDIADPADYTSTLHEKLEKYVLSILAE